MLSKKKVWEAKKSPKAFDDGYVSDTLMVATESLDLLMGSARTTMMAVAINLYGKPLFWFEPSDDDDNYKICCIFYGAEGKPIAYINRNEYIALVGKQDIVSKGVSLTITDKKYGVLLELSREGDQPLHIKRLFTQLYSTKVVISGENSAVSFGDINTPNEQLGGISGLTLAGQGYSPNGVQTALGLGGVPQESFLSIVYGAMQISRFGKPILRFDGSITGWVLGNRIINKAYRSVGILSHGKAYSIAGEYVADYIGNQLLHSNDQYESGEPIYIIHNDRSSRNAKSNQGYDLSYRFS